jgi:hypothetical protein
MDSEPDVIGFYVDPAGNVPGVCQPFTAHTVHLLITRPSDASGLSGYHCTFTLPANVMSLNYTPAGGIIIIDVIFPELDIFYPTPQPALGDVYNLGIWQLMVLDAAASAVLLADHFPGQTYEAAYLSPADELIAVHTPDWGDPPGPCQPPAGTVLAVNDPDCCGVVLDAESVSWGRVKSMYR